LRPAGAFAFTVESPAQSGHQPLDSELGPSGRYRHSRRYLAQALAAAGLTLIRSDEVVLRSEFCRPTQGLGVLARVLP
jgi:predicted TPR repeat methyltransferase